MEIVFQDKKMQDKFKRFEAGAKELKVDRYETFIK